MKVLYIATAMAFFSAGLASAEDSIEQRNFFNTEWTKSIKGTLRAYDSEKKVITIQDQYGNLRTGSFDKLADDCKDYVLSVASLLGKKADLTGTNLEKRGLTSDERIAERKARIARERAERAARRAAAARRQRGGGG